MEEKIRVILPEKYDLVVGDTFQLFYRGVIMAPNPYCYDIVSVCEKGRNFPRYFEFTPEKPGVYKLEIYVYDANRNVLGKGETELCVIEAKISEKPINILCIGDSLTGGGQWVSECYRRIVQNGGEPEGLGFTNVSFVGTCKKDDVGYEGYGGWTWEKFLSGEHGGVFVWGDHEKTEADQHSLWRDDDNNIWKMETIGRGWFKFLRYGGHDAPRPETGKLTHECNAKNKDDIFIKSSRDEKASPFYNYQTEEIDFKNYCRENGIDKIDAMYILLGGNSVRTVNNPAVNSCPDVVKRAKEFVDIVHNLLPDVKIKIMTLPLPSVTGGCGSNYGALLPYCDRYGVSNFVFELNLQYEAWTKEKDYCDFMEYINISGQFDAENSYPETDKPVNIRSTKTEKIGTNALHPTNEGYMQIADAVYRNMVHFIAEE